MKYLCFMSLLLGFLLLPINVWAHEVYVLDKHEAQQSINTNSLNPLSQIFAPETAGIFGISFVVALVIFLIMFILFRLIQNFFSTFFQKIKPYASIIGQITLGLSLLASAFFNSLYGPELSLRDIFGINTLGVQIAMALAGVLILTGLMIRVGLVIAMILFVIAFAKHGFYMLTYLGYLGEILLLLIVGNRIFSSQRLFSTKKIDQSFKKIKSFCDEYSFLVLRICLGTSLIYSSVYAKFIHSQLAVMTVEKYNLTQFFPFPPLFVVLGAFIIETILGIFFIIGFELRLSAAILTFFLTLSLVYFGESVWPHLILYGTALVIFVHGADKYTVEERLVKKIFNLKFRIFNQIKKN